MEDQSFVLITGATSDIGMQICATLEASGCQLLMTDLEENALTEARSALLYPQKHRILALDLSDVEQAETTLSEFMTKEQLHVSNAVFAAGVFSVKPLKMINYAFLKKNFDIALFSIFALTRVLTSKKVNSDYLHGVVMISSVTAIMGTKGYCIYGAVKAAMLGLLKSLAAELAPRCRVNAVLPGGVRTRTTNFMYEMLEEPNSRYLLGDGQKSDISNMVEFLLSDKARWITGQGFVVDGGYTVN
jgi:NAD(P)-dependent dehydrogenase (short-subunit alcohol dehydrogenase family)